MSKNRYKRRIAAGAGGTLLMLFLAAGAWYGLAGGERGGADESVDANLELEEKETDAPEETAEDDATVLREEPISAGEEENAVPGGAQTGAEQSDAGGTEQKAESGAGTGADTGVSSSTGSGSNGGAGAGTESGSNGGADAGTESRTQDPGHSQKPDKDYEVGDIMEDGAMYTGGDVEAGLDYIRENPEIWDQIVWH